VGVSAGASGVAPAIAVVALALTISGCGGNGQGAAQATARPPAPLAASAGRSFFVSPDGDDSAPGSSARPWRTIQKAFDTLHAGQRALVRSGTYVEDLVAERPGRPDAPITVAAEPGAHVVLRPASTTGDTYPLRVTSGAAYLRVSGFVIERASGTSSTNIYFEGTAHDIELSDNEIRFSQDQGVFSERTTVRLRLLRNRIHDNGLGHEEGQHQSHGIYLEGRRHYVANNVVYDHPYGFGIQVYPENTGSVLVNNTVVASGHAGIVVGGADGVGNIVIRNNILAFNRSFGVQMDSDCPDGPVVVATNVLYGNADGPIEEGCAHIDASGGNVLADPRFADFGLRDLQLLADSPGIDSAEAGWAPATDVTGAPRPSGAGSDIGAYEVHA
jgi:hypothetical protein